ncbi:MAG: hypothetical protein C0513_04250 [Isosphaera sp.]|nr:hypothetical protein [Isosphaera sp.]
MGTDLVLLLAVCGVLAAPVGVYGLRRMDQRERLRRRVGDGAGSGVGADGGAAAGSAWRSVDQLDTLAWAAVAVAMLPALAAAAAIAGAIGAGVAGSAAAGPAQTELAQTGPAQTGHVEAGHATAGPATAGSAQLLVGGALSCAVAVVSWYCVMHLAGPGVRRQGPATGRNSEPAQLSGALIRRGLRQSAGLRWRWSDAAWGARAAGWALPIHVAVGVLVGRIAAASGRAPDAVGHEALRQMAQARWPEVMAGALVAVVAAPLVEETLFRGYAGGALSRGAERLAAWRRAGRALHGAGGEPTGQGVPGASGVVGVGVVVGGDGGWRWWAIGAGACLFAAAHAAVVNREAMLSIAAVGALCGWAMERRGGVAAAVVIHAAFNAYNLALFAAA